MNQDLLELALLDELRTVKRIKRLEADLIEQYDYAFNYVMTFAEQNRLPLPNHEALLSCLRRISELTDELNPTTRDATHRDDHANGQQNL